MDAVLLDLISVADNHEVGNKPVFVVQVEIKAAQNRYTSFSRKIICKNNINVSGYRHMVPSRTGGHSYNLAGNQLFSPFFPIHPIVTHRHPSSGVNSLRNLLFVPVSGFCCKSKRLFHRWCKFWRVLIIDDLS